jgi:hypothetical protein
MVESVDHFRDGDIDLTKLVHDLRGLLGAADLHDGHLVDEFWAKQAPIDMELELRTEAWAPGVAASDDALECALREFRGWASGVLAATDDERT